MVAVAVWRHSSTPVAALPAAKITSCSKNPPTIPDGQQLPYLGNGIIGYRVKPIPFVSWKGVASGYVMKHPEGRWETLAYAPYPFAMDFRWKDGPSLTERAADVRVERQSFDMTSGELTTQLVWPSVKGDVRITVLQFISRTTPVVACQEVLVQSPASGELEVAARVGIGPGSDVVAAMPPK